MNLITATIITYNEEKRIAACLESIKDVVDEIIVIDSFSTDNTLRICAQYGCKITQRKFNGYGAQKQYALTQASNSYVLSIDADEILSDELRASILHLKDTGFTHRIYCMKSLNYYCNKPILHCGWHDNTPTRLFDKRYASWNLRDVNEAVIFPATLTPHLIPGNLLHFKSNSEQELLKKEESKAAIDAKILHAEGYKGTSLTPYIKGLGAFLNTYIAKMGFADGRLGLEISKISAKATFLKYKLAKNNFNEENS